MPGDLHPIRMIHSNAMFRIRMRPLFQNLEEDEKNGLISHLITQEL